MQQKVNKSQERALKRVYQDIQQLCKKSFKSPKICMLHAINQYFLFY